MLADILLVVAGLAALLIGGDGLVSGAGDLASRLGIPRLVVGLTVVSFATSSPELAVSIMAALDGTPDLAVGNVFGSNIFNVLVAVGGAAVIGALPVQTLLLRRDIPVAVVATLLVLGLGWTDLLLARWEGLLLFALLVGYLAYLVRHAMRSRQAAELGEIEEAPGPQGPVLLGFGAILAAVFGASPAMAIGVGAAGVLCWLVMVVHERLDDPWTSALLVPLGVGVLLGGSRLLVDGATGLATSMGISQALIGLTVVAAGTSLPELATSLVAARKGETAIAVGNAVGSNVFNLLAVLGLAAAVHPIEVSERFVRFDGPVAAVATVLPALLAARHRRLGRPAGIVLLSLFGLYLATLIFEATRGLPYP